MAVPLRPECRHGTPRADARGAVVCAESGGVGGVGGVVGVVVGGFLVGRDGDGGGWDGSRRWR